MRSGDNKRKRSAIDDIDNKQEVNEEESSTDEDLIISDNEEEKEENVDEEDKKLKPFWNKHSIKVSKKLWCSTTSQYFKSHPKVHIFNKEATSQRLSIKSRLKNSWVSIEEKQKIQSVKQKKQKTTYNPKKFLSHLIKKKEKLNRKKKNTDTKELKSRKIRIYPSEDQKAFIDKHLDTCRWTYNQCVAYYYKNYDKYKWLRKKQKSSTPLSFELRKELRNHVINNVNYKNTENEWVIDTPSGSREGAMLDLIESFKTMQSNGHTSAKIRFKSKKDRKQTILIRAQTFNSGFKSKSQLKKND
jgi:hypothetical protein